MTMYSLMVYQTFNYSYTQGILFYVSYMLPVGHKHRKEWCLDHMAAFTLVVGHW